MVLFKNMCSGNDDGGFPKLSDVASWDVLVAQWRNDGLCWGVQDATWLQFGKDGHGGRQEDYNKPMFLVVQLQKGVDEFNILVRMYTDGATDWTMTSWSYDEPRPLSELSYWTAAVVQDSDIRFHKRGRESN